MNDSFLDMAIPTSDDSIPVIPVDAMANYVGGVTSGQPWTGDKFYNSFGITKDYEVVNHWLLRKRSKQLFTENLYARGLIRRMITNEINKGLSLEATPDANILGLDREELSEWSENTERRHTIWGNSKKLCDYRGLRTYAELEKQARMMAIVSGDVLVVLRQGPTGLPLIDLFDAEHVSYPQSDTLIRAANNRGNKIVEGVEVDSDGRHVAFFINQANGKHRRVTAVGAKTGRTQAWLVYGTERLLDDVRGTSLLALVMQSLKEMDRNRDAELRAAVVNSMIAMWIEKNQDKMGSLPINSGATRRDSVTTQNDSAGRKDIEFSQQIPGLIFQELQHGEKPVSYDTRRPNVNFGVFESAIINAIAWANEMPPEILTLSFASNYSASRAAVNEWKMYLDRRRAEQGDSYNNPIYREWLISETLSGNIVTPGFLDAWRDPEQWDRFGAWVLASWAGAIKPSVDLAKDVKAYTNMVAEGSITRDRMSKYLTGMKFSKVVETLKRENVQLAEALQPLVDAGLIKNENPGMVEAVTTALENTGVIVEE